MNANAKALLDLQAIEFSNGNAKNKGGNGNGGKGAMQKLRSKLSAQVLRMYDSRKRRFGKKSVVPIRHETCTGCQVRLSRQTQREARKRIVPCEHCGRLVYNPTRSQRLKLEFAVPADDTVGAYAESAYSSRN